MSKLIDLNGLARFKADLLAVIPSKEKHDFTLTTSWTSNTSIGDFYTYPYKQTISTDLYTSSSENDWKILAGTPTNMPNSAEITSMKYLSQFAQFGTTGITLIATNPTTTNLTVRVMG